GFFEEAILLLLVNGLGTARGARGGVATGVANPQLGQFLQAWPDEGPGAHVERLLLAPDPLRGVGIAGRDLGDLVGVEGINLLEPDDGGVADLVLAAVVEQVVVDLPGAENEAADALGRSALRRRVVENFLEGGAFGEIVETGDAF